jgi:hypothetical protein
MAWFKELPHMQSKAGISRNSGRLVFNGYVLVNGYLPVRMVEYIGINSRRLEYVGYVRLEMGEITDQLGSYRDGDGHVVSV